MPRNEESGGVASGDAFVFLLKDRDFVLCSVFCFNKRPKVCVILHFFLGLLRTSE